MFKTYVAKPSEITRKWWLIDAENLVVGRLSAIVANINYSEHATPVMKRIQQALDAHLISNCGAEVDEHQNMAAQAIHPLNSGLMRSTGRLKK